MKQQYINKVKKELNVSLSRKKEIIRDIEEAFSSAIEHGETEKQVIDRLGSPEEFAASVNGTGSSCHKKPGYLRTIVSAVITIFAFTAYGITKLQQIPEGAIGQADAMTNIRITSEYSFDFTSVILVVSVIALIITIANVMQTIIRNRRK